MPLGILRLNAKKTQPNNRITFIKPLKGQDEAIAQDFLERIAAQCLPIMKEHCLAVTTLEEYEFNREFVGRNFNGGEVIQLVLRARSGHWLPFGYVQMVMMHELAHCVQMSHSRAFWAARNLYAAQMRALWGRRYTGDGMWGRGALLGSGEFEAHTAAEGEALPEHLCGGAFRSRRRKRRGKGAQDRTYQERKQRRIEKKFGRNGVALGADDAAKARLEKGKRTQALPRVAGSKRGRELRAAAALARFEEKKQEPEPEQEEDDSRSEESDYEDADDADLGAGDALDIDGEKLRDTEGNRMVKVCQDDNSDDEDAANELHELQSSITTFFRPPKHKEDEARPGSGSGSASGSGSGSESMFGSGSGAGLSTASQIRHRDSELGPNGTTAAHKKIIGSQVRPTSSMMKDAAEPLISDTGKPGPLKEAPASNPLPSPGQRGASCPVCSFENDPCTVTCSMCSNVLNPDSVPGTWRCRSSSCQGGVFLNAGDCGTCGVCGQRKPAGDSDG